MKIAVILWASLIAVQGAVLDRYDLNHVDQAITHQLEMPVQTAFMVPGDGKRGPPAIREPEMTLQELERHVQMLERKMRQQEISQLNPFESFVQNMVRWVCRMRNKKEKFLDMVNAIEKRPKMDPSDNDNHPINLIDAERPKHPDVNPPIIPRYPATDTELPENRITPGPPPLPYYADSYDHVGRPESEHPDHPERVLPQPSENSAQDGSPQSERPGENGRPGLADLPQRPGGPSQGERPESASPEDTGRPGRPQRPEGNAEGRQPGGQGRRPESERPQPLGSTGRSQRLEQSEQPESRFSNPFENPEGIDRPDWLQSLGSSYSDSNSLSTEDTSESDEHSQAAHLEEDPGHQPNDGKSVNAGSQQRRRKRSSQWAPPTQQKLENMMGNVIDLDTARLMMRNSFSGIMWDQWNSIQMPGPAMGPRDNSISYGQRGDNRRMINDLPSRTPYRDPIKDEMPDFSMPTYGNQDKISLADFELERPFMDRLCSLVNRWDDETKPQRPQTDDDDQRGPFYVQTKEPHHRDVPSSTNGPLESSYY